MMRQSWTDDLVVLERIYADDSIPFPLRAACEAMPHRTMSTIGCYASRNGFAAARQERLGRSVRSGAGRPRMSAEQRAERDAELEKRKAERLGMRDQRKLDRIAEAERVAAERKLQRLKDRANRQAQRKRARESARAAKIRAAATEKLVAAANAAADIAKKAIERADRLARDASIAPLVAVGRPVAAAGPKTDAHGAVLVPIGVTPGECDLGDREKIRRRLVWTRDALSAELGRPNSAIERCIRDVAKSELDHVNIARGYTFADLEPDGAKVGRRKAVGM